MICASLTSDLYENSYFNYKNGNLIMLTLPLKLVNTKNVPTTYGIRSYDSYEFQKISTETCTYKHLVVNQ